MAVLGVGLSAILAIANKTLHVEEDPRIDAVESLLPGANCGACGFAGCRALAEQVVAGGASPAACSVSSKEDVAAIARLLGIEVRACEKRVARVACAGGTDVAAPHSDYIGIETCRAAALVAGGGKSCPWGCLGYGDCMQACRFGAITMSDHRLPVVAENQCTACGACVSVCPKSLFEIHPVSHRLWVACRNRASGKLARTQCDVACIGCGLCKKDAAEGLIEISNNLAVINYDRNEEASPNAIQRCPTGAIVWMDETRGVVIGESARKAVATPKAEEVAR